MTDLDLAVLLEQVQFEHLYLLFVQVDLAAQLAHLLLQHVHQLRRGFSRVTGGRDTGLTSDVLNKIKI